VIAALVVVLAAVTVIVLTGGDDEPPAARPGGATTSSQPEDSGAGSPDLSNGLSIAWANTDVRALEGRVGAAGGFFDVTATDDVLLAVGSAGVIAFDLDTGDEVWEWTAPAGAANPLMGGGLCAYAVRGDAIYLNTTVPNTVDDNPTTRYDDYLCAGVVSLDNDGEKRWEATITDTWRDDTLRGRLRTFTVVDDQLIAVATDSITSFTAGDGTQRWRQELPRTSSHGTDCGFVDAMAGGELLAVSIHCGNPNFESDQEHPRLQLEVRSATDGSPRNNGIVYDNPRQDFEVKIVHAGDQGIVLASASQPNESADTLTILGPDGTLRKTHQPEGFSTILSQYWTGAHPPDFHVVNDTLIAFPRGAGPMAFRMSTGEQAWALGLDVQQAAGVLAHDGNLYFPYGLEDTLAPYDVQTGAPVDGAEGIEVTGFDDLPKTLRLASITGFLPVGNRIVAVDNHLVAFGFAVLEPTP
jgi:hypothetical protein